MKSIPVSWIPAHPSYGSISMLRYWRLMAAECRVDDPFACQPILPMPTQDTLKESGKFRRQVARRLQYPIVVKAAARGKKIAHVLDHSWADMFPHLPHGVKKVVTVHDLIPLRFPGELTTAQAQRFRKWVTHIKQADAVIAVSEYTKSEVIELLGISGNRVHVVPNGVVFPPEHIVSGRVSQIFPITNSAFLIGSLGSTLLRKNLEILPAALAILKEKVDQRIILVRAGAKLGPALKAELESILGPDGLIELGMVTDDELEAFYQHIDAMTVPSHYEGFGLPVLEAMARNVPVVAAQSSSLPEVGGNAALFFKPDNAEECAAQFAKIVNNSATAERLANTGLEHSKSFSWRQSLEGCYAVYERLLG